jgi:hypothetical protein
LSGGWFRCPASAWPSIIEAVRAARPLERDEAIADLRWQLDQRGDVESRRALAKRWGWSEWATRELLASEHDWRVDVRPVAAQVHPTGRPSTAHPGTGETATSREIRPPAAHPPPADLPAASTRAVDPDFRQQTSDSDQSQSEARAVRAEAVASVLAGWLARRRLSDDERSIWEAGGEAFLRRLRKSVDSERSLGALGLPDLRAGIALALARHDARPPEPEPEREPEPDEPATEPEAWPEAVAGDVDEPHAGDDLEADAPSDDAADATDRLWSTLQASQVAPAWARSWSRPDVARRLRPAWKGAAIEVEPPSSPAGMRYLAMVADAYGLKLVWRNAA